jgi:hypothetical protein
MESQPPPIYRVLEISTHRGDWDMSRGEDKKVPVMISERLFNRVKARVERSGEFSSVEEYISFILEEILSEGGKEPVESAYTKEEEEEIKSKLQALGYL